VGNEQQRADSHKNIVTALVAANTILGAAILCLLSFKISYTMLFQEFHMINVNGNSFEFSLVGCISRELLKTIRRINVKFVGCGKGSVFSQYHFSSKLHPLLFYIENYTRELNQKVLLVI